MKQGKNIVGLVVMGVTILFALFAYFAFNNMTASTDKVEASNKLLSADVTVLKEYQANSDQTQADKIRYEQEMKDIIAQFPKEVRPEDLIMYAQSFEQNDELVVLEIEMPVPSLVPVGSASGSEVASQVAGDAAADGTMNNGTVGDQTFVNNDSGKEFVETTDGTLVSAENLVENGQASTTYSLFNASSKMKFESSYTAIKNVIKKINEDPMRKSLDGVKISFDYEKGVLTGELNFNSYFLLGSDVEYVPPVVNGVGIGSKDIFRSADSIKTKRDIDPEAALDTDKTEETTED